MPGKCARAVVSLLALAVCGARAAAATNGPAPLVLDGIAAEVGEERVTIAEAMLAARSLAAAMRIPPSAQPARLRELYDQALEDLIARKLILQHYEKSEQKLSPGLLESRINAMIAENFGGDRARLIDWLAEHRLTYEEWRKRVEEEIICAVMRQQFVERPAFDVSPADVRAYYATNGADFALEGSVRVGLILLTQREDEEPEAFRLRARRLAGRLREGMDFAAAAREESAEEHAAAGGDWGFVVPADVFRPEIARALEALGPGEVSEPIETESGIYIVRKTEERPERRLTLAEAWPLIESRLRQAQTEARYRAWIESLKRETRVVVHPLPGDPAA